MNIYTVARDRKDAPWEVVEVEVIKLETVVLSRGEIQRCHLRKRLPAFQNNTVVDRGLYAETAEGAVDRFKKRLADRKARILLDLESTEASIRASETLIEEHFHGD